MSCFTACWSPFLSMKVQVSENSAAVDSMVPCTFGTSAELRARSLYWSWLFIHLLVFPKIHGKCFHIYFFFFWLCFCVFFHRRVNVFGKHICSAINAKAWDHHISIASINHCFRSHGFAGSDVPFDALGRSTGTCWKSLDQDTQGMCRTTTQNTA